jgi:prepilin-type processing-associated H-X9-DG protein
MSDTKSQAYRFQFTLRHLLWVMTGLCAFLGVYAQGGVEALWIACYFLPLLLACLAIYRGWYTIALLAGALSIYVLLPTIGTPRHVAERSHCTYLLRVIMLSIQEYYASNKQLPQRVKTNQGLPFLSWRVAILPYLEPGLFSKFNQNEPWNGPTNLPLAESRFSRLSFHCPSDFPRNTHTSYVAVAGRNTCWPANRAIGLQHITDGTSNTILITEQHHTGIVWSEPRDLDENIMNFGVNAHPGVGISSSHGEFVTNFDGTRRRLQSPGANVAFADGSVRFLSSNTDPEIVKRLLDRRDGRTVEIP